MTLEPKTNTMSSRENRPNHRIRIAFSCSIVIICVVALLGLMVGSYPLSPAEVWSGLRGTGEPMPILILQQVRIPRTITAIIVGAALGISGLLMQTLFRNPLADPQVLGVSSGASLGVAFVILVLGSKTSDGSGGSFTASLGISSNLLITVASAVGSAAVMLLILFAGRVLKSSTTLLLLGVMVGYLVSSAVTVMLSAASPQLVQQYTMWGFGSYQGVTWNNLVILAPVLVVGIVSAFLLSKSLNSLLLGERYAQTMGVNLRRLRVFIVFITAVLSGTCTAFCGPISFLGIAIPHLCRGAFRSSDHRVLVPACALIGGSLALTADIAAQLPGENILPLNAVNAAFGAPVVIFILLNNYRKLSI